MVAHAQIRHLTRALAVVDPGGEVSCLDGYGIVNGFVTIAQSVTIDCGAAGGTIPAMQLTVSGPGIVVRLRNLKMLGIGSTRAIAFTNGATRPVLIFRGC
jgi:hypothetical protein